MDGKLDIYISLYLIFTIVESFIASLCTTNGLKRVKEFFKVDRNFLSIHVKCWGPHEHGSFIDGIDASAVMSKLK